MTVHELPPPVYVWLTIQQAIEHTGLSRTTLWRATRSGELQYSGGGSLAVRIRLDLLDEWLENRGRDTRG